MGTTNALQYALLCTLHKGPMSGYEIVRRMRRPIGYYWSAVQSQIYPELGKMTESGLITSDSQPGPGPYQRRTHQLTGKGRAVLAEWLVRPPVRHPMRDELILKTYAVQAADPAEMRKLYLDEAERRTQKHAEYQIEHDELVAEGATDPSHPNFGTYATVVLGLSWEQHHGNWCRWLASQLKEA